MVPWVFSFGSKNRIYTDRVGTLTARIESNIQRETWAKKRCYFKEKNETPTDKSSRNKTLENTHTHKSLTLVAIGWSTADSELLFQGQFSVIGRPSCRPEGKSKPSVAWSVSPST